MNEFDEMIYSPIPYDTVKKNYQPRQAKKRGPRFSDDSLAVGCGVTAVLVLLLTIFGLVVIFSA